MKNPKIFLIAIICAGFLSFAGTANAAIGLSPADIENNHLLRGSEFTRTMNVSRDNASEALNVLIKFSGDQIKDWVDVEENGEFVIPSGVYSIPIKISIKVPATANLGVYKATIDFVGVPLKAKTATGTGVNTQVGVQGTLRLTVTDKKISSFTVNSIESAKVETGSPLKFNVGITNTGNMPAKPSKLVAEIRAFRSETILESYEITDFAEVKPFFDDRQTLVSTKKTALNQGVYNMTVSVFDGTKKVRSSDMTLELYAQGERVLGSFQSFRVANRNVSVGDNVTVAANFKNTGKEDVSAKFVLSVWTDDGKFVGTVESERATLTPNNLMDFNVNFNAQKAGSYVLKGMIDYDGRQTAEQQLKLRIHYPLYIKLSVSVFLAIIMLVVLLLMMGKRRK